MQNTVNQEQIREAAEVIAEMRKPSASRRLSQRQLAKLRPKLRDLEEEKELQRLLNGTCTTRRVVNL